MALSLSQLEYYRRGRHRSRRQGEMRAVRAVRGRDDGQHMVKALGHRRMEKYLSQTGGHARRALDLYRWDAQLSSAMWNLLSLFEVVLRNKLCDAVEEWSEDQVPKSNKQWLKEPKRNVGYPLAKVSTQVANSAQNKAKKAKELRDKGSGLISGDHPRKGHAVTQDDIVAQVTLTQWKEAFFYRDPKLLDDGSYKFYPNETTYYNIKRVYDEITIRALSSGPKTIDPNRASLIMYHAILLRNRISHQEPLIDIECKRYRKEIFELLNCLNPRVLNEYSSSDPIPEVLRRDPRKR